MPIPPSDVWFEPGRAARTAPFGLTLLDCFRLECQGRALAAPQAVSRLLAFIGVRGRASRAELAGSLWPEASESKAHACLRTTLWRLRQVCADPVVIGSQVLTLAPEVEVDVVEFVGTARRVLSPAGAPALITAGELLPGWYDDWVLFERERLRQLQMHALEAAATKLIAMDRHADAIEAALAAVRLEPLRESANRVLILAHLAENNVVEAVRCFEGFRASLLRELGVAPTAGLRHLALGGLVPTNP
ncbi:BTAD domain-containing putative transcriptional regulator [Actinoplanes sp. NPDC026670]|jgi:DNA-binding SARP family transcriptional activator|uniref:AfsR/SARP family transcriptional regulator n=1 Tax=Actinoplanes sp. NPDC026670 TaxID=3154700 RepID=UPI0033E8F050